MTKRSKLTSGTSATDGPLVKLLSVLETDNWSTPCWSNFVLIDLYTRPQIITWPSNRKTGRFRSVFQFVLEHFPNQNVDLSCTTNWKIGRNRESDWPCCTNYFLSVKPHPTRVPEATLLCSHWGRACVSTWFCVIDQCLSTSTKFDQHSSLATIWYKEERKKGLSPNGAFARRDLLYLKKKVVTKRVLNLNLEWSWLLTARRRL